MLAVLIVVFSCIAGIPNTSYGVPITTRAEICTYCGRYTALGNHSILPCGHIGCLKPAEHVQCCSACKRYKCNGKDHAICPNCKVHWCVHVDLECEYTRNPAPTPYATVGPDGKTQSYYTDPQGQYVQGCVEPVSTWSPGIEYAKKNGFYVEQGDGSSEAGGSNGRPRE